MNERRNEDPQIDQIDDLAPRGESVQDVDAEQVRGGFNPQPEPPTGAPVFRPPTFNLDGIAR